MFKNIAIARPGMSRGLLSSLQIHRSFHATPIAPVKAKYLKSVERVQKHFARMMLKQQTNEVDPVLGRKVVPFVERVKARVSEETNEIQQMDPNNTVRLLYGAEQAAMLESKGDHEYTAISQLEAKKREALQRIISLQNASQKAVKKLAVEYAVKEFGRFEGDTGSSEVQAAVSTIKIHYLANHLKENKKNYPSLRKLEMMVQGRQRMLKYLKRTQPERYFWAIEKLGLSDEAVTQEFHLSRKYFAKVRFFGDRTLPVKLNKKERAAQHKMEKMKKRAKRFMKA
ncbi:small ribosomal subunit protein uS15m [Trichomonascus vanleenenianus]|uniref:mitochondrial 37S ribosomal protein uS15m MRPS28 n=1 Tax=Trichomonascus vanleenenianus TaxID=2268995 RepID=UPI003EC99B41